MSNGPGRASFDVTQSLPLNLTYLIGQIPLDEIWGLITKCWDVVTELILGTCALAKYWGN